jgi:PAS domain S-box-containing protein
MEEYVWISKLIDHPVTARHTRPVLERLAERFQVEITVAGPPDDSGDEYIEALKQAVDRRAAGIMVTGWNEPGAILVINRAVKSGIPVVTTDCDIPSSMRIAHVGTEWYRMGKAMAERLGSLADAGPVLLIGMAGQQNTMAGIRGLRNGLVDHPRLEIVAVEDTGGVSPEAAQSIVSRYLEHHPDLAAVVAFDCGGGCGAAAALIEAGRESEIRLVCVDTDPGQAMLIRSGVIDAAFVQKREAFTYLAFQMLYAYNHGSLATRQVPGLINIPGNIDTGFVVVTAENIDTYEQQLSLDDAFRAHELSGQLGLLSSMIENIQETALAADPGGRIIYANPAAASLSGRTESELRGMTIEELFGLSDEDRRRIRACLDEGIPAGFETVAIGPDGTPTPVKMSISPISAERPVRGFAVVAMDLTEQRRFAEALRESAERYRLIVDNTSDLIVKTDGEGCILYASPAWCSLFGRTAEDVTGQRFVPLVHEEDRLIAETAIERLREPPYSCSVEQREMTRLGWRWIAWSYKAIRDQEGAIDAVVGVGRDVTDRKRLEDQFFQTQKMDAIGQLAGGIAHDFNNALVSILGTANLLKLESKEGDAVRDAAQTIEKAAERAAELTRRLLGFARRGRSRIVTVDMNAVITGVVQLLSRTVDRKIGFEYETHVERALVTGDPAQLERIILNLAVNARDAMPDGGTLRIETAAADQHELDALPQDADTSGGCLRITVTDTGLGIPREHIDRVFEPFFTTKPVAEGAGMGLAVVYSIVRSHEGHIAVESEPGEGTKFTIYLPAEDPVISWVEAGRERAMKTGSGTIMLVDDEELVRKTATDILDRLGYEVLAFEDAESALKHFWESGAEIDLVILDMIMPGMDGVECFRRLRRVDPLVKVLLSTGYVTEAFARDILDEGAAGFLPKPYSAAALSLAVSDALSR